MSAEKTLAILDLFDFETRSITVSEISKRLSQPISSSYRHLRILKNKGYIIEVSQGKYKLGYRFLKMAKIVRTDSTLMKVAHPIMEKLMEISGETIILSVRSNLNAVCLDIIQSYHPIAVTSVQGGTVPLHCGAMSKVLLAAMDEKFIDKLFDSGLVKKYQEKTITDKDKLIENLKSIRELGYAFSDSELDEGVLTYGIPLYDFNRTVIASLGISGPRERMLTHKSSYYLDKLIQAKKEIEQYM